MEEQNELQKRQWKREENRLKAWEPIKRQAPNLSENVRTDAAIMQDGRAGEILASIENLTATLNSVTKAVNDMNASSGRMYDRLNWLTGVIALMTAIQAYAAITKH